jgi:hypothetical protein
MSPVRPDPVARERRCFELLEAIKGSRAILIGGYAVSSYGLPRFSVDLDLVVHEADAEKLRGMLQNQGLKKKRDRDGAGQVAGGFEQWSDGLVSVDMLINGVSDRRSGASFKFATIEESAANRTFTGRAATASATAKVAAPETLIVLKLCAGRLVDIRDIAILSRLELRWDSIEQLVSLAPADAIMRTLDRLTFALGTLEFKDSFKGEFMMKEPRYQECVASAKRLCDVVRRQVSPPR